MAQYDVLAVEFDLPENETEPAQLKVIIDNPQAMILHGSPTHNVPPDVEEVPSGELPTQHFWVNEGHHQLTITLKNGSGSNPLIVTSTGYYNFGTVPNNLLDIVVAVMNEDVWTTRGARRNCAGVANKTTDL